MKYLPIHPAMIPFLKPGMHVHGAQSWKISHVLKDTDTGIIEVRTRTTLFNIKYFSETYLLCMRISTKDIVKLKGFNGQAYISKYSDYITVACSKTQLTHEHMKADLASKKKPSDYQFPTGFTHFHVGMDLLLTAGRYIGDIKTITSVTAAAPPQMTTGQDNGIKLDGGMPYTVEWLAKNSRLVNMSKYWVTKCHTEALHLHVLFRATKQAEQAQAMAYKDPLTTYTAHSFDRTSEPTSWLALDLDTGERLSADTEEGIKAKVALAIAADNKAEYQVFARVGAMKCEQTLKFIK